MGPRTRGEHQREVSSRSVVPVEWPGGDDQWVIANMGSFRLEFGNHCPDMVTEAVAVGDVTQVGTLGAVVLHPGCII